MESRNEIFQQSVQLLMPGKRIQHSLKQIVAGMAESSHNLQSYKEEKKREKSYGMRNYLKIIRDKEAKAAGIREQNSSEAEQKTVAHHQSSSKDERHETAVR